VIETATKMLGHVWGDEGSSRIQHAWTADPGIARRLATGQAGYIHHGGCTWVQVARPRPSPLQLPSPPPAPAPAILIPPAPPAPPGPATTLPPGPRLSRDGLDDAFGPAARARARDRPGPVHRPWPAPRPGPE
jgi:hypothetical protein